MAIVVNIFAVELLYGWRISVGIQALTGTLLALGMGVAPRSPRSAPLCGRHYMYDGERVKRARHFQGCYKWK